MKIVKFSLICLIVLVTLARGDEIPRVSVDSRDFVRTWLVCGPFPNPVSNGAADYKHDHTCVGFFTDYLQPIGGEQNIQPITGLEFNVANRPFIWQWHQSETDYIDLFKLFTENQRVVAYAACLLIAETDQTILLGLGSNDGAKLWLNGEPVWENHLPRGAEPDADWVRVHVRQGENRLLLKIDQGFGNWGFYLRVLDLPEKLAELNRGVAQEMLLKIDSDSTGIFTRFGQNSRYKILEERPVWELQLFRRGTLVQKNSARLGEAIHFPKTLLHDGSYHLVASVALQNLAPIRAEEFYYYGVSPHQLLSYDRSRKSAVSTWTDEVALLNSNYETVKNGTRAEGVGKFSLLRDDVSPFFLRVNLPSGGLGTRMYLLDNLGAGYQIKAGVPFTLDLPHEALRCLQHQMQQRFAHETLPVWFIQNLEQRMKLAGIPVQHATPEKIYQALDLLSTLKTNLKIKSDFPVWFAPGIEKVGRDEPIPAIQHNKRNVFLARNEYEPFQLVLHPNQPLEQFSVKFAPDKNKSGNQLAPENFEVLRVDYVKVTEFTDFFGSIGDWPDPLPSLTDSTRIAAGQNTPLWITVFAPANQPAGTYQTRIQLFSRAKKIAEIPLEIVISDFTLPEETHTEVAYGVDVNRAYHGVTDEAQFRQVHDLYMQLCATHRISPYSPQAGAEIKIFINEATNEVTLGFTEFDLAMGRYLDEFKFNAFNMGGLPGELAGHPMYSDRYNELFHQIYGEIQEHLREKGWLEKAYWYWVDEPPKSDYAKVRRGMELLKSACPEIRRLLTCNQEDAPVPYFFDTVNLWVPIMDKYSAERAHARQRLGETVWWYVCTGPKAPYPNNFITHPAINHRIRFWMVDAVGLDGSLYWSLTWWGQNPWEQAMSVSPSNTLWGNGDGRLLYPPRKTIPQIPVIAPPVRSIRFENLRDGLEDREVFLMLRQNTASEKIVTEIQRQSVPTLTTYEQNPALFWLARHRMYQGLAEPNFK